MIEYMNSEDRCMICSKEPDMKPELNILGEKVIYPLIKHHVSYYPEVIAFVHYDCHKKIHNTPLNTFIQYEQGDSRKYYKEKSK